MCTKILGCGLFNRNFEKVAHRYESWVARALSRIGRRVMLLLFGVIIVGVVAFFVKLPASFLPGEDQGAIMTLVQAPSGTTAEATEAVLDRVSNYWTTAEAENVESVFSVRGFSFAGQGQNVGMMFVRLADWEERTAEGTSAEAIGGRAFGPLMGGIREALVIPIVPPAVLELGNSDGFSGILTAAAGQSHEELLAARSQLLGLASQSQVVTAVRPSGVEDATQFQLNIDWAKAGAVGVTAAEVGSFLSTIWSGTYVNDFIYDGRIKRVYVQGSTR